MHLSESEANTHVYQTTSSRRSDGVAPLGESIPNSLQDLHVGEPTQQAQLEVPTDLKTVNDHKEVSSMQQENVSHDDTHGSRTISPRRSFSALPCVEPTQQAQQDVPTVLKTVEDKKEVSFVMQQENKEVPSAGDGSNAVDEWNSVAIPEFDPE